MKTIKKIAFLLLLLLIICRCGVIKRGQKDSKSPFDNQVTELEYYYAFTEATKMALFSDFSDALKLYQICIQHNPKNSAAYFQVSNILMRTGNIESAKVFARIAIKNDKQNIWYLYHLASLYQLSHNLDSTILVYRKIVKLNTGNVENWYNLALLYNEAKEFKKALKIAKAITKEYGINERILFLTHDVYKNLGRKKRAIDILDKGSEMYSDNLDFKGLLAEDFVQLGFFSRAKKQYLAVLHDHPEDIRLLLSYGDFLLQSGNGNKADSVFKKIFMDPEIEKSKKIGILYSFIEKCLQLESKGLDIEQYIKIAKLEYGEDIDLITLSVDLNTKLENYDIVSKDLKLLLKNNPDEYSIWERIIYTENVLGRNDSVIAYSDKATIKFGGNQNIFVFKGLALAGKGEKEDAIVSFKAAEILTSDIKKRAQIYGFIAETYKDMGKNDSSDYYFEKAILTDKNNDLLKNNYSYYLSLREVNLLRAKELSKNTLTNDPDNSTYLDTYGWILFKMGLIKQAKRYIEKAIKYNKAQNTEILQHYGEILIKLNKRREALEVFRKASKIDGENDTIKGQIELLQDKK